MKSAALGSGTLGVEVTRVTARGFWLLLDGEELFVAFAHFPWFRDAPVVRVRNVRRPAENHLRWPDLDIDLAVESIRDPAAFPLVSKENA